MISILSWNIQNGLGIDGQRSLPRIAQVIAEMGSADVLCLQEVSRHLAFEPGGDAPDQVAQLTALFPDYAPIFGAAYDILGGPSVSGRVQYGNLVLSRLPVLSVFCHPLPQPPRAGERQMPRQAIELTVGCGDESLRIMTTHLEFHSVTQRRAQIDALKTIHESIDALASNPPSPTELGPYQHFERAGQAVVCGDFNCLPDSAELAALTGEPASPSSQLVNAWTELHAHEPPAPTCGIFDRAQWPEGPHCRDYFLVSQSIRERLIELHTQTHTDASDHQPIKLTLQSVNT